MWGSRVNPAGCVEPVLLGMVRRNRREIMKSKINHMPRGNQTLTAYPLSFLAKSVIIKGQIEKDPKGERRMICKKSLYSWILERNHGLQALLILMILAAVGLRVLPLELQKRIVNQAIAFRNLNTLILYALLYLSSVFAAGVLKYVINLLQAYMGQKILLDMRSRLYEHILRLPLSFFRRTPGGMVISSLTAELSAVGEFLGGGFAVPLINVLTLVSFAVYLAYLNPLLAALSFSIYPLDLIVVPMLQKRFNRLNQVRIDVTRNLSNVIGETVSGMHEVQGSAAYGIEGRRFRGIAAELFRVRHRMNNYKFLIKFLNNFFQSLGPFILFLLGGYLTINGRLDLGALVAFLSAYEKLYDPWKELMDYYQDFQDSRVRYKQVMDYFDLEPEFAVAPPEQRAPLQLEGRIEVKGLGFRVDQSQILDQISFDVSAGGQLALVGPSGSGKSTLAMVLGQLYSYDAGRVLMDGYEVKSLSKYDISHNVGFVAQHPFIFNGTILDNLLYSVRSLQEAEGVDSGTPESLPPKEEIMRVIGCVGLGPDILRLGLNSPLDPVRHPRLAERIIAARERFAVQWGKELAEVIEFLDPGKFQVHATLAENITFGYSEKPEYAPGELARNAVFRGFLEREGLVEGLVELGTALTRETVYLLKDLQDEAFFFQMSPIRHEDFEAYAALAERIEKGAERTPEDETALLRTALGFIPEVHKMAALPFDLEEKILAARPAFMRWIGETDPGAFSFYRPGEVVPSLSIESNVLFGQPRSDHPQALELVRERVVEVLEDLELTDRVRAIGLEFEVGSMGDRLSGGQKQKIAIARILLKKTPVLIMDEATASLDNTSQAAIQRLLDTEFKGRCTMVSVIHRLETVRDFELIAVLRAGKVVEMGRYDELIAQKGVFHELVRG